MNLWKVEILLTMCVLINTFVNQKFITYCDFFFDKCYPYETQKS